jgi:hypothetical protein
MRLLALLILFGCATQVPLRYKYPSSKRDLASATGEAVVARIEGELKHPVILATGMDSTFLVVKLFAADGALLTDVDPDDLTISTSEDVEAKPFVRKQGVYKAELRPRVKGRTIRMRVDWKERVLSPEIVLETTVAPLKDQLTPLNHEYFQFRSVGEVSVGRGSASPDYVTESFSFENLGDNRIVNATANPGSQRFFSFDYLEQARQNLAMSVDDSPNGTVSHTMHSIFMFFPRKNVPLVEQLTGTIDVTLPTGEKFSVRKDSKEIVGGVLSEGPVDVSTDRFKRQYPNVRYAGRGVVLRVNARGQPPQTGQFENAKIDLEHGLKGSVDVLIINGTTGQRCRRPKRDFWEPLDVTPIEFKFPSDDEFELYLRRHCGFGLPKF